MQVQTPPSVRASANVEEVLTHQLASATTDHKTLPFKPRRTVADRNLEGSLISALLSTDKDLNDVLRELDKISAALRCGKPEEEILRVAVHPAVWYAVKHALIERELHHLALCDDLTCLYNRRGFFAAATQQLKMARRNRTPALLLFCDLDGLKSINDTYGHREGDLALVRAADALETVFRDSDVLARMSGDEFAVLATDLPPRYQQTIFARLQKALKRAGKDEPRYELSLSCGTAWFDPQAPMSLGGLIEQADHAMYERKRGKRVQALAARALMRQASVAPKLGLASS